ncbi:MAG: RadC family protein [Chloroflexota bacterium]
MPQSPLPHMPYPSPRLKGLPLKERPTQRVIHCGATAVSLTELLASLVGGAHQLEVADALVARYQTVGDIARAPVAELSTIKNLGESGAARLKAALELGRRLLTESPDERPQIRTPADAANLLQAEMSLLEQEEVRVLVLDTRNRVLDSHTVYKGSLNTSLVRIGELFREAIRQNAAAVVVAHNHPSGDPSPSPEDIRLTEMLVEAGRLLDVEVLDHLIIGQRWVSLKERGLGFK